MTQDPDSIPPLRGELLDLYITAEQEAAMAAKREVALYLFLEVTAEFLRENSKTSSILEIAQDCFRAAAAFDQAQMEAER